MDGDTTARKYTCEHMKNRASGDLLYDSGNSTRASGQPRGVVWGGRGYMYAYG